MLVSWNSHLSAIDDTAIKHMDSEGASLNSKSVAVESGTLKFLFYFSHLLSSFRQMTVIFWNSADLEYCLTCIIVWNHKQYITTFTSIPDSSVHLNKYYPFISSGIKIILSEKFTNWFTYSPGRDKSIGTDRALIK